MIGQKAIGCTLCAISGFLLIASLTTTQWAESDLWREGLQLQCVAAGSATPLPFNQPHWLAGSSGCHPRMKIEANATLKWDDSDGIKEAEYMPKYMKTTLALVLIALLLDFLGTVLTGLGLKGEDAEKNKKYNLYSIVIFAVTVIFLLAAAIVYPTNFVAEQEAANVKYDGCMVGGARINETSHDCPKADKPVNEALYKEWKDDTNNNEIPDGVERRATETREFSFGFSYAVVPLSIIFILIAIILLILDHFNPEPVKEEEAA